MQSQKLEWTRRCIDFANNACRCFPNAEMTIKRQGRFLSFCFGMLLVPAVTLGQVSDSIPITKGKFEFGNDRYGGDVSIVYLYGGDFTSEDLKDIQNKVRASDAIILDATQANLSNNDLKLLSQIEKVVTFLVADDIRPNQRIDADGVRHLANMRELNQLKLPVLELNELSALKELKNLELLDLTSSGLSDCNVTELLAVNHVDEIILMNTKLSDNSLGVLQQIRSPKRINLTGTQLSNPAIFYLRQVLKSTRIEFSELPIESEKANEAGK